MIKFKSVFKFFDSTNKLALEDIMLKISRGEIININGDNGSGKTTLIKCLSGLLPFDSGEIEIDNDKYSSMTNLSKAELRNEKISLILDTNSLIAEKTVYENIMLSLKLNNKPLNENMNILNDTINYFNIYNFLNKKIKELSTGETHYISIINKIILNKEILIIDEILEGISPDNLELITNKIKTVSSNKVIIIVGNNVSSFKKIFTREITLKNGKIIMDQRNTLGNDKLSNNNKSANFTDKLYSKKHTIVSNNITINKFLIFKKIMSLTLFLLITLISFNYLVSKNINYKNANKYNSIIIQNKNETPFNNSQIIDLKNSIDDKYDVNRNLNYEMYINVFSKTEEIDLGKYQVNTNFIYNDNFLLEGKNISSKYEVLLNSKIRNKMFLRNFKVKTKTGFIDLNSVGTFNDSLYPGFPDIIISEELLKVVIDIEESVIESVSDNLRFDIFSGKITTKKTDSIKSKIYTIEPNLSKLLFLSGKKTIEIDLNDFEIYYNQTSNIVEFNNFDYNKYFKYLEDIYELTIYSNDRHMIEELVMNKDIKENYRFIDVFYNQVKNEKDKTESLKLIFKFLFVFIYVILIIVNNILIKHFNRIIGRTNDYFIVSGVYEKDVDNANKIILYIMIACSALITLVIFMIFKYLLIYYQIFKFISLTQFILIFILTILIFIYQTYKSSQEVMI